MPTLDLQPHVCPLCQTVAALEGDTGSWRCATCHQAWDPRRLATVAAYATYCEEHPVIARRTSL